MKYFFISLFIGIKSFCYSQTILQPGDIAIIGYNFENPDEFSFVTFQNLDAGTVIYFTDCGWENDNSFRVGEGLITYTVPTGGINAFDVVTFNSDPGFSVAGVSGFFGFSISGDQIIAFQGSFNSPQFIYALNNNGTDWQSDATDNNSSALPTGLIPGLTAVALSEQENGYYNCLVESQDRDLSLAAISTPSNWIGSTNRVLLPPSCFENPLPLSLISFNVENFNGKLLVEFKTVGEHNLSHYEIEWSLDNKQWEFIASLNALNKMDPSDYTYINNFFREGYYRLKEYDLDGKFKIFPEVFAGQKSNEVLEYYVFDISGKIIFQGNDEREETEILRKSYPASTDIIFIKMIFKEEVKTYKVFKKL